MYDILERSFLWGRYVFTRESKKLVPASDSRHRLDSCFEDLEKNPWQSKNIKALTGELKGLHRYRIGDCRIIYRISREGRTVEIIAILPRGNAY
jgi:mRNA-degrading endonuclease RelE of RelBE toxin-antitoxin system